MRFKTLILILALCSIIAPMAAALAAPSCTLPASIPAAHALKAGDVRQTATGGYLLSFSWSPEYCYNAQRHPHEGTDTDMQCGASGKAPNHFAFVLHGLWPDGTTKENWPQYCKPVPPVSSATVRGELCRTPSVNLIEHDWEKHGSCGWPTAESYFAQSARLMDKITLPDLSNMTKGQVGASAIRAAFVASNPGLPRASIGIFANKGGWFEEVRLCLDTAFKPRACPSYSFGVYDSRQIKISRPRT